MRTPEWQIRPATGADTQLVARVAHQAPLQRPERPAARPRPGERVHAQSAPDPGQGAAVLLVDDEEDTVNSMQQVVRVLIPEIRVLTARSGDEALATIRSEPGIRAIITDYQMGGMDGLQLAEAAHKLHPGLPVVVVSGFSGPDTRQLSLTRGAFAFVPKPFTADVLIAALRSALVSYRALPIPSGDEASANEASAEEATAEAEAEVRQEEDRNEQDAVQDLDEDTETALQDDADGRVDRGDAGAA